MTNSKPSPLITAAPWMSASLATLVGIPNAAPRGVCKSKFFQALIISGSFGPSLTRRTNDGTITTMPFLTKPGKPTLARCALGNGLTKSATTWEKPAG